MNKLLIITYYWPPTAGSGVQRWLKFVKYLHEFGWEPIIYTPKNPEQAVSDNTLQTDIPEGTEVLKKTIWEPYSLYEKIVGKKTSNVSTIYNLKDNRSLTARLSNFIRSNVFIPDARCLWIRPSVKYLKTYLQQHPVDAIVSTGPPHSMHLIAMQLKKLFPDIVWLADFRDPWTNIDYFEDLKLTIWGHHKHHRLEKKVVQQADTVISVGKTMANEFSAMGAKTSKVITNGFDTADINVTQDFEPDSKFTICHFGVMSEQRNPHMLWQVLGKMVSSNTSLANVLEIKLVGKVSAEVIQSVKSAGLEPYLVHTNYLTHKQVLQQQHTARVLLLVVNNTANARGIITGKIFEYLAAARPILAIGPEQGDLADILNNCGLNVCCGYTNAHKIKNLLEHYFMLFKNNTSENVNYDFSMYSRKKLTKQLTAILNECIYKQKHHVSEK